MAKVDREVRKFLGMIQDPVDSAAATAGGGKAK
jgi:hypothetical protein